MNTTFVHSADLPWHVSAPGVTKRVLRSDEETGGSTILVRFEPGATYPLHTHHGGEEIFALEGDVKIGGHELRPGDYLYTPPDGKHAVSSRGGCLVLIVLPKPVEILER